VWGWRSNTGPATGPGPAISLPDYVIQAGESPIDKCLPDRKAGAVHPDNYRDAPPEKQNMKQKIIYAARISSPFKGEVARFSGTEG